MSDIHTVSLAVRNRDSITQVIKDFIEPVELSYDSTNPGQQKYYIKLVDGLKSIPVPDGNQYMVLSAKYIADDVANEIVAGDPAPFAFRVNSGTVDHDQKGMTFWGATVTALELSTPYASNIEILVEFG